MCSRKCHVSQLQEFHRKLLQQIWRKFDEDGSGEVNFRKVRIANV
eukprot:SAG11_NODE_1093_length_5906_cov_10.683313_2_plen_45_part_00